MLKTTRLIYLIILVGIVSSSKMAIGQITTNQEIESLICKPWTLKTYEIAMIGKNHQPKMIL